MHDEIYCPVDRQSAVQFALALCSNPLKYSTAQQTVPCVP